MPIEHHPRRFPTPLPRFASGLAADASATTRLAAVVLQVAAFAVVLAALPYPVFELDRYTFPKELVLCVAALAATLLCLASARRLTRVRGGRAAGRAISACRRSRRCSRPTAGSRSARWA